MSSSFEPRLRTIVRLSIAERVKSLGFKQRRSVFEKPTDGLLLLIEIERDDFNDEAKAEFAIAAGVYLPGFWNYYHDLVPPSPKVLHCCIHGRMGLIGSTKRDVWWRLCADDPIETDSHIVNDISQRLHHDVLPFLRRFSTVPDVIRFLEEERSSEFLQVWPYPGVLPFEYLAILYDMLGEKTKSVAALEEADRRGKHRRKTLKELRQRLEHKWANGSLPLTG